MPPTCSVPACLEKKSLYKFPKDSKMKKKWVTAIHNNKRLWNPKKNSKVCQKHFKPEDFLQPKPGTSPKIRKLKQEAVPSLFFSEAVPNSRREKRAEFRNGEPDINNVAQEVIVESGEQVLELDKPMDDISTDIENYSDDDVTLPEHNSTLPDHSSPYRIERFKTDHQTIRYFTGFNNFAHFLMFFQLLGPAVYALDYKSQLDPLNELFLTFIKLRLNREDFSLHIDFEIGIKSVGNIFNTWVLFMYHEFQDYDFWLPRDIIDIHFPVNFKQLFPKTRIILDATETPIVKKSNCDSQRMTFSSYKNMNTLKTMIGISPRGVVTYVSPSFGGSVSDRQIIERSPLCKNPSTYFSKGDSIMADRGIMVQDLFCSNDICVNTPTTMKGKTQLDAKTVITDRRIASKRIHIERLIGYAKTFKILKAKLPSSKVPLGSYIISVCFFVTNFRESIVSKDA